VEFAIAIVVLLINIFASGLVFQPSSYMAVSLSEIWNTNLFFATWITASLSSYLVADLITVHDDSGLLPKECSLVMGNAISRSWILMFIATISLLVFSLTLKIGPSCSDMAMDPSSACSSTIVGIVVGGLGILFPGGYLTISLLDREDAANHARNLAMSKQKNPIISEAPLTAQSTRNLVSAGLSVISLICYSINAALMTSPGPPQGLMSEQQPPANVYVNSWICFSLSLYLCIRHVEVYLVPGSQRVVTITASQLLSSLSSSMSTKMQYTTKQRRLQRQTSSRSGSTQYSGASTPPLSQYSDAEDEEIGVAMERRNSADGMLTSMCDSQSEDRPWAFATYTSDIDDDASYPSLSPSYMPHQQYSVAHTQMLLQARAADAAEAPQPSIVSSSEQNRREPHKPRSVNPSEQFQRHSLNRDKPRPVNPSGHYQGRTFDSDGPKSGLDASGAKYRSFNSAAAGRNSTARGSKPQAEPPGIDAAKAEKISSHSASMGSIGGIDTKLQAFHSSSGSDTSLRLRTRKSRSTAQRNQNPEGQYSMHHSNVANMMQSVHVDERNVLAEEEEENQQIAGNGVYAETVSSESGSEWTSAQATNPLDRPTRPGSRDPSFRAPLRKESLEKLLMTDVDSSKAGTEKWSRTISSKSKSKSSRTKSRTSSQKKRQSKSKDRGNGSDGFNDIEEAIEEVETLARNYATNRKSKQQSNNSPAFKDQYTTSIGSGYHGQGGPPTMSASAGTSGPSTNEESMGPLETLHAASPEADIDTRPVRTINGSMETMSVVSDFTGFGPPGEHGSEYRGSSHAVKGGRVHPAHADRHSSSSNSSQTHSNMQFRQGAVDKMVLEALRQAQETRQGTISNQEDASLSRQMSSHSLKSSKGGLTSPSTALRGKNQRGQMSEGSRGSASLHLAQRSASPHYKKPPKSFGAEKKNRKATSSGRGGKSGSMGKSKTGSVHSFYSNSADKSFDDEGNAYAC